MTETRFFLSSPPDTAVEASQAGPVSLMAYRVGRSFRLQRSYGTPVRAELMDVDCTTLTGYGPHGALAAELTRECRRMGYGGMVLDLPRPTAQLTAFCALLCEEASRLGLGLYVPERYAAACPGAKIVTPAQNLSGTYEGRIRDLIARYGAGNVALELERVHTDFALPARTGLGSVTANPRLIPERTFYSPELRANYQSYLQNGRAHLVLWDDLNSLKEKIAAARDLGVTEFFLYYPHVVDILPDLKVCFSTECPITSRPAP